MAIRIHQVYFDVKDENGRIQHWGSEFGPTPLMMRNLKIGWARDSIKAGDQIVITCAPHKTPVPPHAWRARSSSTAS
jgi:hypothetical protein